MLTHQEHIRSAIKSNYGTSNFYSISIAYYISSFALQIILISSLFKEPDKYLTDAFLLKPYNSLTKINFFSVNPNLIEIKSTYLNSKSKLYEILNSWEQDLEDNLENSFKSSIEKLNSIQLDQISPRALERLTVTYYGLPTPLISLASIGMLDRKTFEVKANEEKAIPSISKAILKENRWEITSISSNSIIISTSPINEEMRKEALKKAKFYFESGKVSMRNIRRHSLEYLRKMEKEKQISKDESKKMQKQLQRILDENIQKLEKNYFKKENILNSLG